METEIHLLGTIQLHWQGNALVQFPTDKARALLTYLATEQGKAIRRETLASLLWPDWPEEIARRHLRQAFYLLKKTIEGHAPGLSETLFSATRKTITLNPEAAQVDVNIFRHVLQSVQNHPHEQLHQCETCVENLEKAIRIYQGEMLAGLSLPDAPTFEEWLTIERENLHLTHHKALTLLIQAYLARHQFEAALNHANRQIAADPLRESGYLQAMKALAALGQRSESLAQFETLRRVLQTQLNVEPTEEAVTIYQQIKAGNLKKISAPTNSMVNSSQGSFLVNFPAQMTPFLGRQQELKTILRYLADPNIRLITIVGPGGQGKTRLATEAARKAATTLEFPDGIFFIPLATADRIELVISAIATQMGMTALPGIGLKKQFSHFIQGKRTLLILDNLENLTEQGELFGEILDTAPQIQILATTHEALQLKGETRLPLEGLAYPGGDAHPEKSSVPGFDAQQFFEQIARRQIPDFVPSAQDLQAIHQICKMVDGSPLALEMAAAWVRVYDCPTIAAEITRSLDFLVSPFRDSPDRQRSMRAVFEHSWQLLSQNEQEMLLKISAFKGDFSAQAAIAVAEASPFDLANLLDKSLLRRQDGSRFALHYLLHHFLTEKPVSERLFETARKKHTHYYLDFLNKQIPALKGGMQIRALATIEKELNNILSAWKWALGNRELDLIHQSFEGLFHFYDIRSRFQEGEIVFTETVQILTRLPDLSNNKDLIAQINARLGWFAFHLGQIERSKQLLAGSLNSLRDETRIFSLNYLGAVARHTGDYAYAKELLNEALELSQEARDQLGESIALNILGQIESLEGNFEKAQEFCRKSLQIKRDIGDKWGMTFSLTYLGRVAQQLGEHSEAQSLFEESMEFSCDFGDRRGLAFGLQNLGNSAIATGNCEAARSYFDESLTIYTEIGSQRDAETVRLKLDTLDG